MEAHPAKVTRTWVETRETESMKVSMEIMKAPAPARRRLGAIARGLRTGHAAITAAEPPPLLPEPPPMPEQASRADFPFPA